MKCALIWMDFCQADENRTVAATAMNMHSSRSHLVLQITVAGTNKISDVRTVGKLSLVDLVSNVAARDGRIAEKKKKKKRKKE